METKVLALKIMRCLEESVVALDQRIIERLAHIRKDVARYTANRKRNAGDAVLSKKNVVRHFTTR